MSSDIFAPPSDDERKAAEASAFMAPPSKEEMAAVADLNRPQHGVGDSMMRGAAQGATLGFADEATAGVGALKDWAAGKMGLRGDIDLGDAYDSYIDHIRQADKDAHHDHPAAYTASEVGGGVASSMIPGVGALSPMAAESALGRMGLAAATGGISGAGHSEAHDLGGLAADTGVGAATGAVTQGVLDKVAPLAKKGLEKGAELAGGLGDKLKDAAERRAFKAAVGNQQKAYNEAAERGLINERGRELLDEGVVSFGSSAKQIADRAKEKAKSTGKAIGDLLGEVDQDTSNRYFQSGGRDTAGVVEGAAMAKALRARAAELGGSGNKAAVAKLLEAADDLEARGQMPFSAAQVEKNSWKFKPGDLKDVNNTVKGVIGDEMEQAVGRFGSRAAPAAETAVAAQPAEAAGEVLKTGTGTTFTRPAPLDDVGSAVAQAGEGLAPHEQDVLSGQIRDQLGQAAEGAAAPAPQSGLDPAKAQQLYQSLKNKYGTMTAAAKDARINANRFEKNQTMSLGDKVAAGVGTMALGVKGVALGALNHVARKRGDSAGAVAMDKIGDVLRETPEAFGRYAPQLQAAAQRGNHALGVTHFLLMQQDPNYRKTLLGDED